MEIQSENLEQVKEEIKDLKGRAKAAKRSTPSHTGNSSK